MRRDGQRAWAGRRRERDTRRQWETHDAQGPSSLVARTYFGQHQQAWDTKQTGEESRREDRTELGFIPSHGFIARFRVWAGRATKRLVGLRGSAPVHALASAFLHPEIAQRVLSESVLKTRTTHAGS